MAFLNCNSVTDSASSCVLGSAPPAVDAAAAAAAAAAALAGLFRQSRPLPISALRDLFGPVFISGTVLRSNRSNWGISEESLPRRKDSLRSSHISMFIFWSQSFYFFFFFLCCSNSLRPSSWSPCPMMEIEYWHMADEFHWASCIKSFVSKFRFHSGTFLLPSPPIV